MEGIGNIDRDWSVVIEVEEKRVMKRENDKHKKGEEE